VEAEKLRFAPPVTHVYNPLAYAWQMHGSISGASAARARRWFSWA